MEVMPFNCPFQPQPLLRFCDLLVLEKFQLSFGNFYTIIHCKKLVMIPEIFVLLKLEEQGGQKTWLLSKNMVAEIA